MIMNAKRPVSRVFLPVLGRPSGDVLGTSRTGAVVVGVTVFSVLTLAVELVASWLDGVTTVLEETSELEVATVDVVVASDELGMVGSVGSTIVVEVVDVDASVLLVLLVGG